MDETDAPEVSLPALLDEIRARVQKRREAGEYPPGLEEELEHHFEAIVASARGDAVRVLEDRVAAVDAARGFSPRRIPTGSRLPGGRWVHRLVAGLVRRQTEGVLDQVQRFADAVTEAMEAQLVALADLRARVDGVLERFAEYDHLPDDTRAALADLSARLAALEDGLRRHPDEGHPEGR